MAMRYTCVRFIPTHPCTHFIKPAWSTAFSQFTIGIRKFINLWIDLNVSNAAFKGGLQSKNWDFECDGKSLGNLALRHAFFILSWLLWGGCFQNVCCIQNLEFPKRLKIIRKFCPEACVLRNFLASVGWGASRGCLLHVKTGISKANENH